MGNHNFRRGTEILVRGTRIKGKAAQPEVAPIYLTTAFNASDLDAVEDLYETDAYTYIRTRNPNRDVLAELMTYLEGGEASLACGSGMAAISTTLLSMLEQGDHLVSDFRLYGETLELFSTEFARHGIAVTFADFTDPRTVVQAVGPKTKVLYTEVITNPTLTVIDIEALARVAAQTGTSLVVDNTFTTSAAIRPLDLGAHVVINSLTKFGNGHSDTVAGSATASKAIIDRAYKLQLLLGSAIDPFSAWLCLRGLRTMDLRVHRQMENAKKLAGALAGHPGVLRVLHPSLATHPQHAIASRILTGGFGAMLSFEMPDDRDRINAFMRRLRIAHYAMTLGGCRTTLSHPVTSSHRHIPDAERRQMGITPGLMRVSVGVEDGDDLVEDFLGALEVFA